MYMYKYIPMYHQVHGHTYKYMYMYHKVYRHTYKS